MMFGNGQGNLIYIHLLTVLNPLVTNGICHPFHLDDSTFFFRVIRSDFSFLLHFSMKNIKGNRIAPDGTPRFAASHLGLFCLPMSYKKNARLKYINHFPGRSHAAIISKDPSLSHFSI